MPLKPFLIKLRRKDLLIRETTAPLPIHKIRRPGSFPKVRRRRTQRPGPEQLGEKRKGPKRRESNNLSLRQKGRRQRQLFSPHLSER